MVSWFESKSRSYEYKTPTSGVLYSLIDGGLGFEARSDVSSAGDTARAGAQNRDATTGGIESGGYFVWLASLSLFVHCKKENQYYAYDDTKRVGSIWH